MTGEIAGLKVRVDVPLGRLTTFKIGGPAAILVTPENEDALRRAMTPIRDSGIPVLILGNGSNLLVSDAGFPGLVLRVGSALGGVEPEGPDRLRIGAGTLWSRVLRFVMAEGWTGLEFGAGIPGTLGGAIATNAGTRGGETADSLVSIRGVGPDGEVREIARTDLPFVYRRCELPEGYVVTSTLFAAGREDPEKVAETVRGYQAERRRDQPEREPSAGCVFKNPPGTSAGKLIDQAGLKGSAVGGAIVSEVHGNFIINRGEATADDVLRLIDQVRAGVRREFGVELELEVRRWGFGD
ncbi:MAG: UDP-N-acetylmuramate dehydrogenase [Gemmatimonadetes bacterium]|nr:UDP-N-acetylmuramate dehydrogenase [Gemmatimonadota bacterium]